MLLSRRQKSKHYRGDILLTRREMNGDQAAGFSVYRRLERSKPLAVWRTAECPWTKVRASEGAQYLTLSFVHHLKGNVDVFKMCSHVFTRVVLQIVVSHHSQYWTALILMIEQLQKTERHKQDFTVLFMKPAEGYYAVYDLRAVFWSSTLLKTLMMEQTSITWHTFYKTTWESTIQPVSMPFIKPDVQKYIC